MPPSLPDARLAAPAFVLALVLLGALALGGWQATRLADDAPGTMLPVRVLDFKPQQHAPGKVSALPAENTAGPGWETLNTPQKLALYPLAERWALLSEVQKRRWLALAQNFASLPEEEQAKLHSRMTEWASLSGQQRNQARVNFARTQRLDPTDKRARWEAYQALSEEEKRNLAAGAAKTPTGAALALKPAPDKKLAQIPAATQADPQRANSPKIPPITNRAPRVAAPVVIRPPVVPETPPTLPPPPAEAQTPPPEVTVETSPVVVPQATPAALPPLVPLTPAEKASTPLASPDNSGLYPQ